MNPTQTNPEVITYELTFYTLGEDVAPVRVIVEKHGGKVVSDRAPQKVRLGYAIEKQQYAFLSTLTFTGDSQVITPLSVELNLSELVLRFQVSRRIERKEVKRAPRAEPVSAESPRAPSRIKPFDGTLSNEALEKKIEEILK